ncbi:hypothetical protein [Sphingomonas sp.]|jgi:hypothetical protein|uniref:hypothetical protein n=1 Tax=Sphingomonas sp. TaxID=28214 RepID=UPI002ED94486
MLRLYPAVIGLCLLLSFLAPLPARAQVARPTAAVTVPGYADLADMVLAAPVIADATVRSTARIKGAEAAGVAPGRQRVYVEADVTALVRGAGGTPPRIGYLVDLSPDADGRFAKLKKMRFLILARPAGAPGQLQLVAPDAHIAWTPEADARVRAIAQAVVAPDAPPRVTGIGNAFHVPGALPGEGETQVFVATEGNVPMSLSILRRPGEQPRWAVALSEVVDEAAGPPARETLLWYRLACGLPAALPESATATLDAGDAEQARTDYAFVLEQLGPCDRTPG